MSEKPRSDEQVTGGTRAGDVLRQVIRELDNRQNSTVQPSTPREIQSERSTKPTKGQEQQ